LSGSFFMLVAVLGVFRLPDIFSRMQAATKAMTLGASLIIAGSLVFYYPERDVIIRGIAIILFLFITEPIGAHIIARAAYLVGLPMCSQTLCDHLKTSTRWRKNN
jgi:multicomponent Na+:H+ antiporter subunit G